MNPFVDWNCLIVGELCTDYRTTCQLGVGGACGTWLWFNILVFIHSRHLLFLFSVQFSIAETYLRRYHSALAHSTTFHFQSLVYQTYSETTERKFEAKRFESIYQRKLSDYFQCSVICKLYDVLHKFIHYNQFYLMAFPPFRRSILLLCMLMLMLMMVMMFITIQCASYVIQWMNTKRSS